VAVPRPIRASDGQPSGPLSSSRESKQFWSPRPLVARPISFGKNTLTFVNGIESPTGTLEIRNSIKTVVGAPRRSGLNDARRLAICAAAAVSQGRVVRHAATDTTRRKLTGRNLGPVALPGQASRRGYRSSVWSRRASRGYRRRRAPRRRERVNSDQCRRAPSQCRRSSHRSRIRAACRRRGR
jgi:hypothetical protein